VASHLNNTVLTRNLTAGCVIVAAAFAVGGLGQVPGAWAQDRLRTSSQAPQPNKEGEYGGVTPGKSTLKGTKRKNQVSWIGFQPQADGSTRLFVQLSNDVEFSQEVRKGVLVVHLDGARYRNRNAQRRLDTRFFATTLRQVTSRRVGKRRARGDRPARTAGIEVRIQFKDPQQARVANAEMVREKDGFHYLFLDFTGPVTSGGGGGGDIDVSDDDDSDE